MLKIWLRPCFGRAPAVVANIAVLVAAARCARTDLRLCAVIVAVRTRAVRAVAPRATVKSCGSGAPAGRALAVSIVTVAAERVPLPTRSTKSTKVAINAPGF